MAFGAGACGRPAVPVVSFCTGRAAAGAVGLTCWAVCWAIACTLLTPGIIIKATQTLACQSFNLTVLISTYTGAVRIGFYAGSTQEGAFRFQSQR
jgi:hypothetical protein